MEVMVWFYNHSDTLGRLMRKVISEKRREEGQGSDKDDKVSSCELYNLKTLDVLGCG